MKKQVTKITIHSELGCANHPTMIEISMDGSQPDCPITFWHDGEPFFSMGSEEISDFIEALQSLDPS